MFWRNTRDLRTGSFRGPDLFKMEDIETVNKSLMEYTARQATLELLSLKPSSAYTVSRSAQPRYNKERRTQQTIKKTVP